FQRKLADKFGISVYLDMNQDYINWRVKTNPLLNYHGCLAASVRMAAWVGCTATQMLLDYGCQAS
ncbi:MAG: hypothetical protein ACO1Q7_08710, partial [Gemmatimonas sp.]